jgi:6-phosphogluconolactonase
MKLPHLLTSFVLALGAVTVHATPDQWVYVGTYTAGNYSTGAPAAIKSKGIYLLGFDSETGKLTDEGPVAWVEQPSFVAVHPSKKYLYAVSETDKGKLSAFQIDPANGHLTPLNVQPVPGAATCHVNVDATGKMVVVASYSSGNFCSYPIKEDGSLGPLVSNMQDKGPSKVDHNRQMEPYAHSMNFDKANRFAFGCDLGCDKIFSFKVDPVAAKLTPNEPAFVSTPPGGGPRHFAFHPSGKFAFATNEMTCALSVLSYDADKGELKLLETPSSLPPGVKVTPEYSAAEVQVHPSGKFVYASERGHDTLACYSFDASTGKLTYIENAPAGVKIPRNFGIDPSGKWIVCAGFDSDSVVVFSIDQNTGKLTATGQTIKIPQPVCVKFLKKS